MDGAAKDRFQAGGVGAKWVEVLGGGVDGVDVDDVGVRREVTM